MLLHKNMDGTYELCVNGVVTTLTQQQLNSIIMEIQGIEVSKMPDLSINKSK